jgi:hypothetical protein
MVLDIIVRSTRKLFGDVCPSVSMVLVKCNQDSFFIVSPFALFQLWIKMVHESLSTLLSLSAW